MPPLFMNEIAASQRYSCLELTVRIGVGGDDSDRFDPAVEPGKASEIVARNEDAKVWDEGKEHDRIPPRVAGKENDRVGKGRAVSILVGPEALQNLSAEERKKEIGEAAPEN